MKVWLSRPGQDQSLSDAVWGELHGTGAVSPSPCQALADAQQVLCWGGGGLFLHLFPMFSPVLSSLEPQGVGQAGGALLRRGLSPHLPSRWAAGFVRCETQPDLSLSFFFLFLFSLLTCMFNSRLWNWLGCGLKKNFLKVLAGY